MEEIWKDIEGWEGKYQVSNLGRVKNIDYRGKEKNMKCNIINGYLRVHLSDRKTKRDEKLLVHRLVAIAFVPNPNNYPIVNHKDETPLNCVCTNLEWCDYIYNANYGTAIQRKADKLSKQVNQYTLDGKYIGTFKSTKEVEKQLHIFSTSVAACCRGEQKSTGGFKWRYAS